MILFPGIALLGIVCALSGFARLSARREWLHLPIREWRLVKTQLMLFLLCYPSYWLLSNRLWSVQDVAIPVFTVAAGVVGAMLGRRWLSLANGPVRDVDTGTAR
jgi:hypothetical protein